MSSEKHTFIIDADHYQFYLEDNLPSREYGDLWSKEAHHNRIDVLPGLIAVGTSRYGIGITVIVEIGNSPPTDELLDQWDHVVDCAINLQSNQLVLTNPATIRMNGPKIGVTSGSYQARIYYGNLDKVNGNDDMEGDDHYKMVLWPGKYIAPKVIKRKPLV